MYRLVRTPGVRGVASSAAVPMAISGRSRGLEPAKCSQQIRARGSRRIPAVGRPTVTWRKMPDPFAGDDRCRVVLDKWPPSSHRRERCATGALALLARQTLAGWRRRYVHEAGCTVAEVGSSSHQSPHHEAMVGVVDTSGIGGDAVELWSQSKEANRRGAVAFAVRRRRSVLADVRRVGASDTGETTCTGCALAPLPERERRGGGLLVGDVDGDQLTARAEPHGEAVRVLRCSEASSDAPLCRRRLGSPDEVPPPTAFRGAGEQRAAPARRFISRRSRRKC